MIFIRVFIAALALSSAAPALAHHACSSLTEIEWNSDSQRFEVAMCLRIVDLEDAISCSVKKRYRLESSSDRDGQIQALLQNHFAIYLREADCCRLRWVGCELELHTVWIYFEAESNPVESDSTAGQRPGDQNSNRAASWHELFPSTVVVDERTESPLKSGVVVRCSLLTDVQPEQQNVVTLTDGQIRRSVTLSRHVPEKTI